MIGDLPHLLATLCIYHSPPPAASIESNLRLFFFALCLSCHFFGPRAIPIPASHLPPTNYSFKVVFRVFRDFHSVPVKPLICSNWNIMYRQCPATPHGTLVEHVRHAPIYHRCLRTGRSPRLGHQ